MTASIERSRDIQMKRCDVISHVTAQLTRSSALWQPYHRKTTWHQNNMAASLERSRDMQMKSCDVICHVMGLDESEPSTQLTRSASWRQYYRKAVSQGR